MHIAKRASNTAIHSSVIPYEVIKMIIDIAIEQDKGMLSTLTQVSSNWRHATLYHRFKTFDDNEWIDYFRWIKESGIQFDISVYVKDVYYTYPHDMLTCFTTLNLDSLTLSDFNYSVNFSEKRMILAFIQSIKTVKKLDIQRSCLNQLPLGKSAFASVNAIQLYNCEISPLFWKDLCAQATNIRKIEVSRVSPSFEDDLDHLKSTNLKVIQIGHRVSCSMIDLILNSCEYFELASFEWQIDKRATNTLRIFEKLKKCKSIRFIGLSACLSQSTEVFEHYDSIDFSQIVSLCLDVKKIERIDIESFTFTNFTRSNVNVLLLGVKDYPTFHMSFLYRDDAMTSLIQEIKREMIENEDAFKKIEFHYFSKKKDIPKLCIRE